MAYFSDISSQVIPEELSGAVLGLPQLQYYPSESYFAAHSSELEFAPHCYNHIYIGKSTGCGNRRTGGSRLLW